MKSLRLVGALACVVSLAAGAASAQTADTRQLGAQVARELFSAVNLAELLRNGVTSTSGLQVFDEFRPGWKQLFIDSAEEVVVEDQPQIEAVLAASLAKTMTPEELEAGLVVFRDPQARAAIAAAANHQPAPSGAATCSAACMRAVSSAAGRGFMLKMKAAFGPDVQRQMAAAIVPDVFIKFGEKAKAAEGKAGSP